MLRSLAIALVLVFPALAQARPVTIIQSESHGGPAAPLTERLWNTMDLESLMPILRDEAVAEAEDMQADLFKRGGTGGWLDQVARIHDPDRLESLFREGLEAARENADRGRIEDALTFYRSDLGRRLVGLENSARRTMLDADAEAAAREALSAAAARDDPRVARIRRLIDEAQLIGPNVAGGMNAAMAFSEGFAEGEGFDMPMNAERMLRDTWRQEEEIRAQTTEWMESYLLLAYSPLSDADLDRYIVFAGSAGGKALSGLMFAGFDAVFRKTSYELGLTAAGQMRGRQL
ncbi:MAG: DUF2059 domain-containing protein [Paracoccus sp. (in: a-proteobacteria)]|uniref:DUF2059 domain-containing protein n=1 Tax=unclassified Paracoccus (in: a-proteobacteria) TaxID=2688777 RepID=UPI000C3BBDA5|nr:MULTISPECIES: DUF2059 domain-containing protein [unclassified Paracoccus (in: a-proteobacteria)]MAN55623.1 hypothetical protein [Paracoccus sp. (in: a-proteobacteria)]MBA48342.1 hypothetical protein [Paracoccus sp. (in: a-proteobacteria)]MCS5602301.1 DUF2059 domain-containing protein [Paracoccus sp. (in: a-proteobacteria)]|tara:strand:+ start:146 stop:1015 length:870 start_codon:yes stop_codon:yes gene_type:complete